MKEIRRKDRAITEKAAMDLLERAEYGVLSTITENGKPYGVPLSYCVIDRKIFFHSAVEGQLIDSVHNNKSVSFCAVGNTEILSDKFGTIYESVIVSGEIEEVFDGNKQVALEGLLHKYSREYFNEGIAYIEAKKEKTRVFMISILELTGKARKQ